jgi:hypothetical protein
MVTQQKGSGYMLLYVFLLTGFIFSLIAVFNNKDGEHLKTFLQSVVIYSILLCIVKINFYLKLLNGSLNSAPITILVLISLVSYLIYQFRDVDIRWK